MTHRLLVAASLVLLLAAGATTRFADGCGLLADAPHACCRDHAAPPSPSVAGSCCGGEEAAPSLTRCDSRPSALDTACSCWHSSDAPLAAAVGAAPPTGPELEARLTVPDHVLGGGSSPAAHRAESSSASSAHDPPLFRLGCAYLI